MKIIKRLLARWGWRRPDDYLSFGVKETPMGRVTRHGRIIRIEFRNQYEAVEYYEDLLQDLLPGSAQQNRRG